MALRILTYNIKSLNLDGAAARRVVEGAAPDFVLVQESPRWLTGPGRMARFARHCGLQVVAGGWRGRGSAILGRPELAGRVVEAGAVPFECRLARFHRGWPTARGYTFVRIAPDAPEGSAPGFAGAGCEHVLTLVSVHFSADGAARARHRPIYRELVEREAQGLVIGGDLNENPRGPSISALIPPMRHADPRQGPTSPVDVPHVRLDAFLVGPGVETGSARVLDGPDVKIGSDHRPVLIDVAHAAWA